MRSIRQLALWAVVMGLSAALGGCGVKMELDQAPSIKELKERTLGHVKTMEDQIAADSVVAVQLDKLSGFVRILAGNMKNVEVGTEEQIATLRGLAKQLGQEYARAEAAGQEEVPASATLKTLVPKVREAIEDVPDSDKRTDYKLK